MAKTINGTVTAYAESTDLFLYHDPNQVADLLREGSLPRPNIDELNNETGKYGIMVNKFLLAASGRVESACLIARMYTPEDLGELYEPTDASKANSASREILVKLVCDLAFWMMCQRRQPTSADPRNVPGAVEAQELLNQLRDGERIFSFLETEEAGLPSVVPPNPNRLITPNVIGKASRLFPGYNINAYDGRGD